MKVLHIIARADHGGAPENILRQVVYSRASIEHHIACPRTPPYWDRYSELLGIERLIEIPYRRFSLAAARALINECRRREFDILHSHGFGGGMYGRLARLGTGVPCLHTFHGFFHHVERGATRWVKLLIDWLAAPLTDRFMAVSESEAKAVLKYLRVSPERIAVVVNGVDADRFRPLVEARPGDRLAVVAVCRLDPHKNPRDLVRTMERLLQLAPESRAELRIVGDGPLRAEVEDAIARAGLEGRVSILGWRNDVASLLQQAHVYLTVSRFEGLSLSMLEAMACGLPVVGTRVQGHTDLIREGINGAMFEQGDTEAAARHLLRLEQEPSLRDALADGARSTVVERFTLNHVAAEHERLYLALLGGARS